MFRYYNYPEFLKLIRTDKKIISRWISTPCRNLERLNTKIGR